MGVFRFSVLFAQVHGVIGGFRDLVYYRILGCLLLVFLGLRMPYIYDMLWFGFMVVVFILPLFLAFFVDRLVVGGPDSFFCGFVPPGTPLWISPFVCIAETIRYLVRPIVLMLRPFLNISIGAMGGASLGYLLFLSPLASFCIVMLFFYELFVALVHWFIVREILSFSKDH